MSTQGGPGDSIDLKAIFRKLLAKWWLFMITTLLALAMAVAYVKTTPKMYNASGVLLMSEKKRNNFGAASDEFIKGTSFLSASGELEDQISVLMSYANVLKTMNKLDFGISYFEEKSFLRKESYLYKPFVVKLDSSLQVLGIHIQVIPDRAAGTYRVKADGENVRLYNPKDDITLDDFVTEYKLDQTARIGEPFRSEHLSFHIEFPEDREYNSHVKHTFVISSIDGLATYYRSKTLATPQSDESNIVLISTDGEVAEKESDFINKLMETYIEGEQYKQSQKGYRTIKFIDDQLGDAQGSLQEAEAGVQQAQAGSGVLGSAAVRSDQLFQDRSRLQTDRTRISARIDYLGYIINTMENDQGANPMAPSASSVDVPVLNNLITQYNNDVNELAQKNLTEKQASAPTIALRRKVQTEREQIINTSRGLLVEAQSELSAVNNQIGNINYMFSSLPENSRRLQVAQRSYELKNELYTYLAQKRAEAQIAVASDQVDKYVVDQARLSSPKPVSPDKKVIFGGALMLGLILPLGFILIRDFFNDTIADLDELKRLSAIPLLSTIPSSKRKRITADEPKSLLAESFRTARINLQYLNPGALKQVIGFTSSSSGEGKTFCALNLATVMALSGKRTVLVDADMRRPRVAEYLGLPEGAGLSTYLIGECNLADMLRHTDVPGLDAITAGPLPPNPLELVETPRLEELFKELRKQYDQVVVDASPMGLVSEYVILMRHVDVSLYVVRQGHTRRSQLRLINEMHQEHKVQNIDLLLNDVRGGEGHGEGYGYYVK